MKTIPIFQHYATNPWRFAYSKAKNIGHGWTDQGIAFQAFDESIDTEPNIIPIYQHKATNPTRFLYSKAGYVGWGWTKDCTAFYAFESWKDGAIAIHQYHAIYDGKWRFMYSERENIRHGWKNDGIAFYALPDIITSFRILELKYDDQAVDPSKFVKRKALGIEQELQNPSDVPSEQTVTWKRELENYFEWGLAASLHYGSEVSCNVGVPTVGEFLGKVSFDITLSGHVKWAEKESFTYEFVHRIPLPPRTAIAVEIIADWLEDCPYPFELIVEFKARSGKKFLNKEELTKLLPLIGCTGKVIDSKKENAVNVLLRGDFKCSMGMTSTYNQRNIPLEEVK